MTSGMNPDEMEKKLDEKQGGPSVAETETKPRPPDREPPAGTPTGADEAEGAE